MSGFRPEPDGEVRAPSRSLWQLDADPAALDRAALAWRSLAGCARQTGDDIADSSTTLLASWRGDSAEAYRRYQGQVGESFAAVDSVAGAIGTVMSEAADLLRRAQDQLDESWRGLQAQALTEALGAASVRRASQEAYDIRLVTQVQLDALAVRVDQLRMHLWGFEIAAGLTENDQWASEPDLALAGRVIVDGDRVIINGTGAADTITVDVDPRTGDQVVVVDGATRRFPASARLIVRGGAGGDAIRIGSGLPGRVTVIGGDGRDTIVGGDGGETIYGLWDEDTIIAGGGADLVFGGADNDYISGGAGGDVLDGGSGQDTVYGLGGDDQLCGGVDGDWLDGGPGDDVVAGDRGADQVVGGRGDDILLGGANDDMLVTGAGVDAVHGGAGADSAIAQRQDGIDGAERVADVELDNDPSGSITIEGSAEFRDRMASDLDALRSTEHGQQMVAALDASHGAHGDTVVIRETGGWPNETGEPRSGVPVGAGINLNPTFTPAEPGGPMRTAVELFHELGHAYDDFYDAANPGVYLGADNFGVPNAEREVVGLPIDHDHSAATPDQLDPRHPYRYTENALRAELGMAPRTRY